MTPSTAGEAQEERTTVHRRRFRMTCWLLILALLLTGAGGYSLWKLGRMAPKQDSYQGSRILPNDIDVSAIPGVANAASLRDFLKQWSQDGGELMHSKYVHNILLLGVDSDSKLSDSMVLLSVNERKGQTHLVSFYRDSYTYLPKGKDGTYCKLNAAYRYGGAPCTVQTIENNYKIRIDGYILTDYRTFPKVIDALGGVDVKVTKKEASYLNQTWKKWTRTHKKIQFHAGTMHMDGEHALMFCRIRKLDSDVGRTNRQRRVLSAILDRAEHATPAELNRLANTLQKNLKTDIDESTRDSLITRMAAERWQDYSLTQMTMPDKSTGREGYAGDQWIWIVDYEQAAHTLQKALYGQSNIELPENRSQPLKM